MVKEDLEKYKDVLKMWFDEKIKINGKQKYHQFIKRQEVIWVDFGINIGNEINSKHPAVVIFSNDNSGTCVVVPLTTKGNLNAKNIIELGEIEGMECNNAKVDQISTISKKRIRKVIDKDDGKYYNNFNKKLNKYSNPKLTNEQMDKIDKAISAFRYTSAK